MGCHKGQGLKQDILFKHHIGIQDQIKVTIPSVDSQVMSCTVAEIAMLAKQFYEPGMGLPFLAGQRRAIFPPKPPQEPYPQGTAASAQAHPHALHSPMHDLS